MTKKHKFKWLNSWTKPWHTEDRLKRFNLIDSYISTPPKRILDIGCGLARESEYFQKKYGTELFLLDGDFKTTENKPRDNQWGTAESFRFYSPVEELKKSYFERQMSYTFVHAENPQIPSNTKFDLIYSLFSCGFHYPAITYKNLIERHSTDKTKIIIDCRFDTLDFQKTHFHILDTIESYDHYCQICIKFK